jgi:chemotaxis protein methyltransferase CheR
MVTPERAIDSLCSFVREHSGIRYPAGKENFVERRLQRLASSAGCGDLGELAEVLHRAPFGDLHRRVVDAMTTNETSFFRDAACFQALAQETLPRLVAARSRERALNVWSAACSSGQEPYSVCMLIREHFPALARWRIRCFATDVSRAMLERCAAATYSTLEVERGLTGVYSAKYFERHGAEWRVRPEIRDMLELRALNLNAPWPAMPPMDLILLRNVLIYFGVDDKRAVLSRAAALLRPDGFLVLGRAESLHDVDGDWVPVSDRTSGCFRHRAA